MYRYTRRVDEVDKNVLQTVAIWHPFCNWLGSTNPEKRLRLGPRPFHLAWTYFQICGKIKSENNFLYEYFTNNIILRERMLKDELQIDFYN